MRPGLTTTDEIRVLVHPRAPGARNMAVDEALMASASSGRLTLRFYGWDPPCLSLGRNQAARGRYDPRRAKARGIDVVRRPTGGRAVYHHRELTYAVTAPDGRWGGLKESYRLLNRALLRGLAGLGVQGEEARRRGPAPGPGPRACFRDPLPGEVVARGRKLVGSAQWRSDGALLQHGSILLHDDQGMTRLLRVGAEDREETASGGAAPVPAPPEPEAAPGAPAGREAPGGPDGSGARSGRAAALADLLPRVPETGRLVEAVTAGFEEELELEAERGELEPGEEERTARLEDRYRSDAWTWRR